MNNPFGPIFERIYSQFVLPMSVPVAVVLACVGVAMWMAGKREGIGKLGVVLAGFVLIVLMPQVIAFVRAIARAGG